jgi:hypothetical protein
MLNMINKLELEYEDELKLLKENSNEKKSLNTDLDIIINKISLIKKINLKNNLIFGLLVISIIFQVMLFVYFFLILNKVENIKLPNITNTEINKLNNIIDYVCNRYVKC